MGAFLDIFRKPKRTMLDQGPLYGPVQAVLKDVRAYARSHGGDIELVGVNAEGDVQVKFRGACVGCPLSAVTLKHGIEQRLRELVPGVRQVVEA